MVRKNVLDTRGDAEVAPTVPCWRHEAQIEPREAVLWQVDMALDTTESASPDSSSLKGTFCAIYGFRVQLMALKKIQIQGTNFER
jgi:hypothetical protein